MIRGLALMLDGLAGGRACPTRALRPGVHPRPAALPSTSSPVASVEAFAALILDELAAAG